VVTEPSEPIHQPNLEHLSPVLEQLSPVARRFTEAGHRLFLVGGIVRDLMLGAPSADVDLTTDAKPTAIKTLLSPSANSLWTQGERFGTIGARVGPYDVEITTHRAESYDAESRKPVVNFGTDLNEDLSRRDFTVNAMAIDVVDGKLVDPYDGQSDLVARRLRTPLEPKVSFSDDPLRMLRAARFLARFDLVPDPSLERCAAELAPRLDIVSVERKATELEHLIAVDDCRPGFDFCRRTGLLAQLLVGFANLDERNQKLALDLVSQRGSTAPGLVRRAGLLWPLRSVDSLQALRYSNEDKALTENLLVAANSLTDSFNDSIARRAIDTVGYQNFGALVALLQAIDRHDPTAEGASAIEGLKSLDTSEDLSDLESPLSGAQIMEILALDPGPKVGEVQRLLRQLRLDNGPMSVADAKQKIIATFS